MIFNKNKKQQQNHTFDIFRLGEIDIGSLEAENDKQLAEYFLWTNSSIDFFKNDCNYIVGTYGVGKSALCKAVSHKKILENNEKINTYFENNYHVINISDKLLIDNIEDKNNFNNAIIFWSSKIVFILIENLLKNYEKNQYLDDLKKHLSCFEELRKKFNEYKLIDYFSNICITPTFICNNITMTLEIKKSINEKELKLNDFFLLISNFFEKINKDCLILIDKIDDYVRFDKKETKKMYIQALHEVVEEIRKNSRIRPILFIREDLYKQLNFTMGSLKVEERSCFIIWTQEEILYLFLKRFLRTNYLQNKINILNKEKISLFKNLRKAIYNFLDIKKIKYNNDFHGDVSKALYYFINPEIKVGKLKKDFQQYLMDELSHGTSKYNPRIILLFFKILIKEQNTYNNTNNKTNKTLKEIKDFKTFDLFNEKNIISSIKKVKEKVIKNLESSFQDEKFKQIFIEIYSSQKSLTKEKDYNNFLKSKKLSEEEIKFFMNQLIGLGYLNTNYQIYNLYKKKA